MGLGSANHVHKREQGSLHGHVSQGLTDSGHLTVLWTKIRCTARERTSTLCSRHEEFIARGVGCGTHCTVAPPVRQSCFFCVVSVCVGVTLSQVDRREVRA